MFEITPRHNKEVHDKACAGCTWKSAVTIAVALTTGSFFELYINLNRRPKRE